MRVLGTGDVGPLYLETALDSPRLGTFVTFVLAAWISGCKHALGAPRHIGISSVWFRGHLIGGVGLILED